MTECVFFKRHLSFFAYSSSIEPCYMNIDPYCLQSSVLFVLLFLFTVKVGKAILIGSQFFFILLETMKILALLPAQNIYPW